MALLGGAAYFGYKKWKKGQDKLKTRNRLVGKSGITWTTEYEPGPDKSVKWYVYWTSPTTGPLPLMIVYNDYGNGRKQLVEQGKGSSPQLLAFIPVAMKDFGVQAPPPALRR
jgi:hypothetical protein